MFDTYRGYQLRRVNDGVAIYSGPDEVDRVTTAKPVADAKALIDWWVEASPFK